MPCEIQVGGHRAGSKRYEALVDEADLDMVGAFRWSMSSWGYVVRYTRVGGKRLVVFMHRELLGLTPGDSVQVDHIHGNKLDNRRENLRICTNAQNQQNRRYRPARPYRGASWDAKAKRWKAYATLDYKQRWLGYYSTQEEAAEVAAAFRCELMPYSLDARVR
jgi:hypothetical protein